ncbi:MAG: TatD family hydrolase [Ezakiella sp.]|nr:TatD family hydrolase [Bacillota bacterium]MDY3922825.1 TatD family hydrolase [Ezakiella sp.]
MLEFIDAHAHYDDEMYEADRDEIIKSQFENGAKAIVNASSDVITSKKSVELANKYDRIYAVIGTHPHEAKTFKDDDIEIYKELLKNPKVVAIGECGLDYHYDFSDRETQKRVFHRMIAFANEEKKPLVIHSREAVEDTVNMLKALRTGDKTLIHCFTGAKEVAKMYLDMGCYLSIGGAVTFKNARHVAESVAYAPLDRLMLETDAPYMTPVPFRGKRNLSIYINYVITRIAEIKNISKEEAAKVTTQNAKEFYGI